MRQKGTGAPHAEEESAALAWLREIRSAPEQLTGFPERSAAQSRRAAPAGGALVAPVLRPGTLPDRADGGRQPAAELLSPRTGGCRNGGLPGRGQGSIATTPGWRITSVSKRILPVIEAGPASDPPRLERAALPSHPGCSIMKKSMRPLPISNSSSTRPPRLACRSAKTRKGNLVKTYTGVLQLQDDFERALEAMPGDGGSGTGDRPPLIVTAVDSGAGLSVYLPGLQQDLACAPRYAQHCHLLSARGL